MLNKNKICVLLIGMLVCFLFLGCSASIEDENQYIDTYDNVQSDSGQKADVVADQYIDRANQIYDQAMEEAMSGFYSEAKENDKEGNLFERLTRGFVRMFYNRYGSLKSMAPGIAVVSVFLGGIIFICSKKNKPRRQFALYGLIIGVPILMLVLVYGIGIFSQMLF